MSAPATTSDGKCTPKYNREIPIHPAKTYATAPQVRCMANSAVAASNDADVCPDGNEKSDNGGINIGNPNKSYGRILLPKV